ncbi:MAG: heparinase II/III family protein [Lachnospiraceae bacterium]|nr:heparinase II/III family protein [Lachnospiraceae bacterium]
MFSEIITKFTGDFQRFVPYASATDRASWENLDDSWKSETIALGKEYLGYAYPYISATDFMEFLRTGNRTHFEDKSFGKRHALSALVLAECVEYSGNFLDDIVNGIFSICEESAWQLPAHNSYIRDTPQLPLPDTTRPVMDLFACETGAILATTYYLLKDALDAISPCIGTRILSELSHRIFTPYLNCHFWWMGNGKEPMNNWTIWCTQNVLLAVFFSDTSAELKAKVLEKACGSVDYFLAEYGDDGCCDEGAQYYRHAGLCLFNTMEILNAVTNDAFKVLYQNEKIKNIAAYILNAHIEDKYYVNFADCSPVAGRAGVREFLFGKQTENTDMMHFSAKDFIAGGKNALLLPAENNLYYRLQNGFTVKEIRKTAALEIPIQHKDIFYPSVGLFVTRDENLYLAVKAGDNGDSHNHNDTGSFTIYKDGKPMFVDIGVESYTKKTFSPQRYEIWTMQSSYHNLPEINGLMQQDGEAFKATNVTYTLGDSLAEISMELKDAYPTDCGIASYLRCAKLIKGDKIVITDHFSFRKESTDTSVVLNLLTYDMPKELSADKGIALQIGTLGNLTVASGKLLAIETLPITDARLKTAWEHDLYRIRIEADTDTLEMCIS